MEISDSGPTTEAEPAAAQQSKPHVAKGKRVGLPGSAERPRLVRKNSKLESDEYMAAAIGDTAWLKQSLRDGRDPTKYDKNGLAAIHLAALHGRLESLKLLIEKYGVDINLSSNTGWRAIHLAINNRTGKRAFQCVEYLLQKGADPSVFNDDDLTPAHQAAIEGTVKCLEAVTKAGGLINTRDVKGHLPIDYAKLWGNRECARILTTEMWKQEKEQEAVEMDRLVLLKLIQDEENEREMEIKKAERKDKADEAFGSWLGRKHLPKQPAKSTALVKKEPKKPKKAQGKAQPQETLYQPNSAVRQDGPVKSTETDGRIKVWNRREPKALKPIDEENKAPHRQARPPPAPQKLTPLAIQDSRQVALQEEGADSEYSDGSLPNLPDEIIDRVLSGKQNPHDRPLVFKCKNIIDVQQKRFPPVEKRPQSEVYMHLSHDISSNLYPSNAHVLLRSLSTSTSSHSSASSKHLRTRSAPDGSSLNSYDRQRITTMMKQLTKNPKRFPDIKGPEYEFTFKMKAV